jgi:hypothetical protein
LPTSGGRTIQRRDVGGSDDLGFHPSSTDPHDPAFVDADWFDGVTSRRERPSLRWFA